MDLSNLALADPWQAADAVAVWQGTPNLATYAIVADGFCHHGQPAAAEEWILGRKEKKESEWKRLLFNNNNNSTGTTTSSQSQATIVSSTYMGLLTAWANYQPSTGYGAQRAEALVRSLMKLHGLSSMTTSGTNSSSTNVMSAPTSRLLWVKCWTIVLEAWCKRVPHCSLSHAERILHAMEQPDSTIQPNLLTYTSYIVGLAQSRRVDAARTAQRILDTTIGSESADLVAYTAVMNAWAKATSRVERRQAATATMRLLERMEGPSRDEEDETDNGEQQQQQRFALNPIVYATAIAAIGNTWVDDDPNDGKDATYFADLAASLVPRMRSQGVTPVTETYNTLLHAYGNLSPSLFAQRAWGVLCHQVPHPTVRTWSAVLRASRGDAPTAHKVLEAMETAYYGGTEAAGTGKETGTSPQPNTVCYTTVRRRGVQHPSDMRRSFVSLKP